MLNRSNISRNSKNIQGEERTNSAFSSLLLIIHNRSNKCEETSKILSNRKQYWCYARGVICKLCG